MLILFEAVLSRNHMATLIHLKTFSDSRGDLTVFDQELPYPVKRLFFIHNVKEGQNRGGHGHFKTKITLVCINGSCDVFVNNGHEKRTFTLDSPGCALLLQPEDWHLIKKTSKEAVIVALASESYDQKDYFYEEP